MGELIMMEDVNKDKRDKLFQEIVNIEKQEDIILDLTRDYQKSLDEFLEDISLITREAEMRLSSSSQNELFFKEKYEMDLIARRYVAKQMEVFSEESGTVLKKLSIKKERLMKERSRLPWE